MRASKVSTKDGTTILYVMNFNSEEMEKLYRMLGWAMDNMHTGSFHDEYFDFGINLRRVMKDASG